MVPSSDERYAGSAMSTKQLAQSVAHGRMVTFHTPVREVTGYLFGMDDYHWAVITAEGRKTLVHKGSASLIDFADESTYDTEDEHDRLERLVGPFRSSLAERKLIREVPAREGTADVARLRLGA